MIVSLPCVGAGLAGRALPDILRFPPPLDLPVGYLRFSSWAVLALFTALMVISGSWLNSARPAAPQTRNAEVPTRRKVPSWTFLALLWVAGWWLIAWRPMPGFEWARRHAFFPL